MDIIKCYKTSDGKLFESEADAEMHEISVTQRKIKTDIGKYVETQLFEIPFFKNIISEKSIKDIGRASEVYDQLVELFYSRTGVLKEIISGIETIRESYKEKEKLGA